jgi:hypothetical protein
MKQIARNVTMDGVRCGTVVLFCTIETPNLIYPVVPRHHCVRSRATPCAAGAQPGPECLFGASHIARPSDWPAGKSARVSFRGVS